MDSFTKSIPVENSGNKSVASSNSKKKMILSDLYFTGLARDR